MRGSGSSSKQLTLIIVLLVVLVLLLGSLVCLTFFKGKETSAPVSQSVSIEDSSKESQEVSIEETSQEASEEASSESSVAQETSSEEVKEESKEEAPAPKPQKPSYPQLYEISHKVFGDEGASYEAKEIIRNGYITKGSIALRNRTFLENLYITPDAEDDPIVLQNLVVNGKIVINGAGKVTLHDVKAPVVEVETKNRENNLIISGVSTIDKLLLKSSTYVDEEGVAKGFPGVKNIVVGENPGHLWLDIDLYDVNADSLYIDGISNIYVSRDSVIKASSAAKMCHLSGSGDIKKLNVYTDGVTYETRPESINVISYADTPEYSEDKIDGKIKR